MIGGVYHLFGGEGGGPSLYSSGRNRRERWSDWT
jgi:hypothetical protein